MNLFVLTTKILLVDGVSILLQAKKYGTFSTSDGRNNFIFVYHVPLKGPFMDFGLVGSSPS